MRSFVGWGFIGVSVLSPVTGGQFATMTYFYEPRGSDRVDGLLSAFDLAFEAAYRSFRRSNVGVKFDILDIGRAGVARAEQHELGVKPDARRGLRRQRHVADRQGPDTQVSRACRMP